MPTIEEISRLLAATTPQTLPAEGRTSSAVALILRDGERGAEVLFIRRASHDADPWSGNIGFPGGRVEPTDLSPRETAERESLEELGLDLRGAAYLGRLDDVTGAHMPVLVSCFVYAATGSPCLTPNREIAGCFWVPLADLLDPGRHREAEVAFDGQQFVRPAIEILPPGEPVLWGLTYRLVMQFLTRLGLHIPAG